MIVFYDHHSLVIYNLINNLDPGFYSHITKMIFYFRNLEINEMTTIPEDGHIETTNEPIILKPHQIDHTEKLLNTLSYSRVVFDKSQAGRGKTFTSTSVLVIYDAAVIHIGPATSLAETRIVYEKAGVHILEMLSYESFGGTTTLSEKRRGGITRHDLLTREDIVETVPTRKGSKYETKVVKKTRYTVTDKLRDYLINGYTDEQGVNHPVFIIADECHKFKNQTNAMKAFQAINLFGTRHSKTYRCILLSGTLFDKPQNAQNMLRAIGMLSSKTLYQRRGQAIEIQGHGLGEIKKWCRKFDDINEGLSTKCFNEFYNQFINSDEGITSETVQELVFSIFWSAILPFVSSTMPPQDDSDFFVYDSYFQIDKGFFNDLVGYINDLSRAARYSHDTQTVGDGQDWGGITRALVGIQRTKMAAMLPHFVNYLESNPTHKIIILCDYIECLEMASEHLTPYGVIEMSGQLPIKDRKAYRDTFNNNDNYRVLIGITSVAGVSVNLHDTVGNRPRTMFKMPNYNYLLQEQAGRRIYREGVKSKATVYTMYARYGNVLAEESNILNALSRKKNVLLKLMPELLASGTKLPGMFPVLIMEDEYNDYKDTEFDDTNSTQIEMMRRQRESRKILNN